MSLAADKQGVNRGAISRAIVLSQAPFCRELGEMVTVVDCSTSVSDCPSGPESLYHLMESNLYQKFLLSARCLPTPISPPLSSL